MMFSTLQKTVEKWMQCLCGTIPPNTLLLQINFKRLGYKDITDGI